MSVRLPEQGWFEKAEQDMEMARRSMDPKGPIPEMACYHSQQCAEKYLKGYLVSQEIQDLHETGQPKRSATDASTQPQRIP